jgi:hypothetical protein
MQPIRMQRRGKVNNASKKTAAEVSAKENEDVNRPPPAAASQAAGVKKSEAKKTAHARAQGAQHSSSGIIDACFNAPKASQKQSVRNKKTVRASEKKDALRSLQPVHHSRQEHTMLASNPNAAAAVGRPGLALLLACVEHVASPSETLLGHQLRTENAS